MTYKKKLLYLSTGIFCIAGLLFLFDITRAIDELGEHPDKIWLHRCNSLKKLYDKQDEYPNIETDIVFREDGIRAVTHDTAGSFHLELESYFSYFQRKQGKIWLDIKNLTTSNKRTILKELNELATAYDIDKNRLIVESPCLEALELFTQNDYYTSFYVTYDKPALLEETEITNCIEELQDVADQNVVDAISFPYWWYEEIRENLNRPIDLLTWQHRTTQLQLLVSPLGKKMLADPQLKVILVKDKGEYHR